VKGARRATGAGACPEGSKEKREHEQWQYIGRFQEEAAVLDR
jgi:hypothetical protein